MAFHIESLKSDLMRSGMSAAEADHSARRRFGSKLQFKEEGHDARSARVVENLTRDARHMARGLRKSPVFTLTVVLTPNDVSTYAIVLALLGTVAALASYIPARRAARVEPLVALRQD